MIQLRFLILFLLILIETAHAKELKIISKSFEGNEQKGISTFFGDVQIIMGIDEMNASKVIIYTDKDRSPYKYIAEGKVSFFISTENNSTYQGSAERAVFLPNEGEYQFFKNVHLRQLNDRKQIDGDEVIVNTKDGTATAKGGDKKPVIMIFNIKDKKGSK